MVVLAHPDPSISAVKKRTRRKMSKKAAQTPAISTLPTDDQEMDDEDLMPGHDELEPLDSLQNPSPVENEDDALMIDEDPSNLPSTAPLDKDVQPARKERPSGVKKSEMRRIPIPPHRMTPLKNDWVNIFGPLTEMLGLQVRMNVPRRCVEVRVSLHMNTSSPSSKLKSCQSVDFKTHERNRCSAERC